MRGARSKEKCAREGESLGARSRVRARSKEHGARSKEKEARSIRQ
jgi:hypothetical protein